MKKLTLLALSVLLALSAFAFTACGDEQKQITGLTLPDKMVMYDGTAHSLAVEGNTEGCEISYTGNGQTEIGEHTVTATVTKKGYETLTLTGKLTITAKPVIEGLTLPGKTVKYDGNVHSLAVEGNTQGCEIVYANNGKTEAGKYTVTAAVTKEGYEPRTLTGVLVIYPADVVETVSDTVKAINVHSIVMEVQAGTKLLDYMNELKKLNEITFTIDNGMIMTIDGKSGNSSTFWMLYTDDADNSNSQWGTYEYEGKTLGSATLGADQLPVKDGCVYVWVLQSF